MRIGPRRWQMVSPDTAGVPTGGKYGDVRTFIREAGRHGLRVAWSLPGQCFGIYTQDGPGRYTFQMRWRNPRTGQPKPLTREFLWLLLHLWNAHCRTSGKLLEQAYSDELRQAKALRAKEQYELAQDMVKDVTNETFIARGKQTRAMISIPSTLGVNHG